MLSHSVGWHDSILVINPPSISPLTGHYFSGLGWQKGELVATGHWEIPPCAAPDLLFTA